MVNSGALPLESAYLGYLDPVWKFVEIEKTHLPKAVSSLT